MIGNRELIGSSEGGPHLYTACSDGFQYDECRF